MLTEIRIMCVYIYMLHVLFDQLKVYKKVQVKKLTTSCIITANRNA